MEEEGGYNLYGFVLNSPITFWDLLGKLTYTSTITGKISDRPGDDAFGPRPPKPPTIPGTDIPTDRGPVETGRLVSEFLAKQGYYTCPKWGFDYKTGKNSGDVQHCMFGCLLTVANRVYFPLAGGTEITEFQWGDLVSDYIGAVNGLMSRSLNDCIAKCKFDICCPSSNP